MYAILLCAGQCTRLRPHTENTPKCLLEISKGLTILDKQLINLKKNRITDVVIVTGYLGQQIEDHLNEHWKDMNWSTFFDEQYASHNNGYSLQFALETVDEPEESFILMNGDVICSSVVLKKLIDSKNKNCGAVVKRSEIIPEEMKVRTKLPSTKILEISKSLTDSYGEFTGAAKFCDNKKILLNELRKTDKNQWFETSLNNVLKEMDFRLVNVSKCRSIEIDTIEDLEKARKMFKREK